MDPLTELFNYLVTVAPDAEAVCAGCAKYVRVGSAIRREEKFFCSEDCADRALALLVKRQPTGLKIDGWDL